MPLESLLLRVAGLDVHVTAATAELASVVAAAWEPALRLAGAQDLGAAVGRLHYELDERDVRLDGVVVPPPLLGMSSPSTFDRSVLDAVVERHAARTVVHAGCVVLGERVFFLVGQSGAGKSTFTRQLLLRGGAYVTDDLVALDDDTVRGVARTVQFKPVARTDIPSFHADCDVTSYVTSRRDHVVPLYLGAYPVIDRQSILGREIVILRIQRGVHDAVRPLAPIERLGALHGAALTAARDYSGQLDHSLGFWIDWDDPDRAFSLLLDRPEFR